MALLAPLRGQSLDQLAAKLQAENDRLYDAGHNWSVRAGIIQQQLDEARQEVKRLQVEVTRLTSLVNKYRIGEEQAEKECTSLDERNDALEEKLAEARQEVERLHRHAWRLPEDAREARRHRLGDVHHHSVIGPTSRLGTERAGGGREVVGRHQLLGSRESRCHPVRQ